MRNLNSSFVALITLSLVAVFSAGCKDDKDPAAGEVKSGWDPMLPYRDHPPASDYSTNETTPSKPRENAEAEMKLGECKTSHEFRKILKQVEASLTYLKEKSDKGELTPEVAGKSVDVANQAASVASNEIYLEDLAVFYCQTIQLDEIIPGPQQPSEKAKLCINAVRHHAESKEEMLWLMVAERVRKDFLYLSHDYSRKTLVEMLPRYASDKQPETVQCEKIVVTTDDKGDVQQSDALKLCEAHRRYKGPIEGLALAAMKDLDSVSAAVGKAKFGNLTREDIEKGLNAAQRLKKSAGAVYLAIACDAKEAFTFLGGSGRRAPGRGSDLDSNPQGPAAIQSFEERNEKPAEAGI